MSVSASPYGVIAAIPQEPVVTGASLSNQTISVSWTNPSPTAGYILAYSGVASKTTSPGSYTPIAGEWETGGAAGENYDCYWSYVSGTRGAGPTEDTWLNFSGVGYSISVTKSGGKGSVSVTYTVKIRDANTLTELAGPVTIALTATRT